jgi:hypothetical protein
MPTSDQTTPRYDGTAAFARLARAGQITLGLIWLIDGILQYQPYMFGKTFITGVILPNASGQPGIIASPITWVAHLIGPHVVLFNAFAATLQVLIGLGLLYRRTVKPALLISFVWALGIWFMGEGLGGFFNDGASPLTGAPGAALLYVIVGLMVWPAGPTKFGPRAGELGLVGVRGARYIWSVLWLGFAVLWLLPVNSSAGAVHDAIVSAPSGAGWLTSLINHAASATAGDGTAIAIVMAIISAAVATMVYRGHYAKTVLGISIALQLVYWFVGQGLGGIFTGTATDVSTAPLVIVIAALLIGVAEIRRRQWAAYPASGDLAYARTGASSPELSGLTADRVAAESSSAVTF